MTKTLIVTGNEDLKEKFKRKPGDQSDTDTTHPYGNVIGKRYNQIRLEDVRLVCAEDVMDFASWLRNCVATCLPPSGLNIRQAISEWDNMVWENEFSGNDGE